MWTKIHVTVIRKKGEKKTDCQQSTNKNWPPAAHLKMSTSSPQKKMTVSIYSVQKKRLPAIYKKNDCKQSTKNDCQQSKTLLPAVHQKMIAISAQKSTASSSKKNWLPAVHQYITDSSPPNMIASSLLKNNYQQSTKKMTASNPQKKMVSGHFLWTAKYKQNIIQTYT